MTEILNEEQIPAATEQPPRPPLWARILRSAAAIGLLLGLAEVCWLYRLTDLDPDWRSALPTTLSGLGILLGVAAATDVALLLVVGGLWGVPLAIWRDLRESASRRDRRFAVTWGILSAAGAFLWVGCVGLYIFPATTMGTARFRTTMVVGVVVALLGSAVVVWLLNRLRRVHRVLPTVAWAVTALALVLLLLPAYSRRAALAQEEIEIPFGPEGPRPNVLLITLDTLRFDALACDGVYRWMTTPHIDQLAADGVLFEQAISQAPSTTPSHCSIMTSVYPNVHDAFNGKPMRSNLPTLAQCLAENGYHTLAFTSSTTTRSVNTGLDRGFERYVDSLVAWSELFSRDEFQNLLVFYMLGIAQHSQIRGDVVTQRALNWLDERGDGPFFCWLHYFDPHDPYDPPPPYDALFAGRFDPATPMRAAREAYAGEVAYTDAQVGRVIDALKARGLYDDTLIVVTSDHGEGFGETHWAYVDRGHASNLYDTTQHVPLIIKPAKSAESPRSRRVRDQVELIDIAPTILEYLNLPAPEPFAGRSLAAALRGDALAEKNRPAHAMTWVEAYDPAKPEEPGKFVRKLAHRTPEWKYIVVDHYNQQELYDLRRDPDEYTNVAERKPDLCAERLEAVKQAMPMERDVWEDPRSRLAPAIRKQLEALGYLGGAETDASTNGSN